MQLGMVGLGRMGGELTRRLLAADHEVVVTDLDPSAVSALADAGATGAADISALVARLDAPRVVWVMVPAAVAGEVIDDLAGRLGADDVVVDGGNSFYQDDVRRAAVLAARGIHLVDVGTSGGVWGRERGYCLMVGGEAAPVARLEPVFEALAPGVDSAPRTPGRTGDPTTPERGWLHCGPPGAGHFVKMVHNGIEYGLMAAYAEGLNVLAHADAGSATRDPDAETAPLRESAYLRYDFDVAAIAEVWRRGSVISSWLLDLTASALAASPDLDGYAGRVSDSGEGRWAVITAVEEGVPAPVLTSALYGRFASRDRDDFANRVLSAMREQFGDHRERPEDRR